jgi:murein tripeptide amidase MpaA
MKVISAILIFALLGFAAAWERDYTGYTVQRCSLKNEEKADLIQGVINAFSIDRLAGLENAVDLVVPPKYFELFQGFGCEITIQDIQQQIDEEQKSLKISREYYLKNMNDSDAYHKTYHTYSEIVAKVNAIAAQYPSICTVGSYGSSIEGRDLRIIRIKGTNAGTKKTIYINGGIHAREWISSAVSVYLIQNLAEKYGNDPVVTSLLNAIEFVITPMSNPDGYDYTWTSDRLWRKNRNQNQGNTCKGVDLNRNFDVYWGTDSSANRCAEDYHGTSAASEPEARAIQNLVTSLSNKIGAIDIHSYGQYIMRPYGWTTSLHPDEVLLRQLGQAVVDTIRATNGVTYSNIRSSQLYPVSGASDDWFTVKGNFWGFCWELRDAGRYGFRLPEDQILPTGQEIFAGLLTFADFVLDNSSK